MGFDVKITTFSSILDLLCPHICRGCGCLGELFCERCKKYNNFAEARPQLPNPGADLAQIYPVGWREGVLKQLVQDYKYQSVRDMAAVLAELVDQALPAADFAGRPVTVVPLPTIPKHIRQRGFDHTLRLGQQLARRRGWACQPLLARVNNTVQVGTSAEQRVRQASQAYAATAPAQPDTLYLLLDDVWTTGASMQAAAKVLRGAGAQHLAAAVVAVSR